MKPLKLTDYQTLVIN